MRSAEMGRDVIALCMAAVSSRALSMETCAAAVSPAAICAFMSARAVLACLACHAVRARLTSSHATSNPIASSTQVSGRRQRDRTAVLSDTTLPHGLS